MVSATPSSHTPNINDGTVFALAQVGTRIIVGGSFTNANPPGDTNGAHAVTRNFILAFDQATGTIDTGFVPTLDGTVRALTPGPTANTVYVGGEFNNVDGTSSKSVTLLNVTNGAIVSGFHPSSIDGSVWGAAVTNGHLIIGGIFTHVGGASHAGIASLNATTGAVQTYVTAQLTGHHNYNGVSGANGGVGDKELDVSPDGSMLVAVGNFKMVDGVLHDQVVLMNLGATAATVDTNWNTSAFTAPCASGAFDTYMRDVAMSPDGTYFVVATTGGNTFSTNTDGTRSSCDSVTRWNLSDTGSNVRPVWIDYTGNDSFESITTSGTAIYAGGHQRWVNNSSGGDSQAAGAIPRPGINAFDPVNGMPFTWNPGRNPRGAGAYALLATAQGLYVGDDTNSFGTGATFVTRKRIGFFPLAGGETVPQFTPAPLPANIYLAGELPNNTNTNVLYRVDSGGNGVPAIDNGPDWAADNSDPSPYRNSGSNTAGWSPIPNIAATVPAGTPSGIFDSERWDPGSKNDGGEMQWSFPVTPGIPIEVRLYFANRYTGTSGVGQRVFDVSLDGATVLDHYDIVADTGDQTGTMKAFDLTSPAGGQVTVGLTHEVENPKIDGIEIVRTDQGPPAPGDLDKLQVRSFTGTSAGPTTIADNGTIAWSTVRGAFMAGNELFYGATDGNLYQASFDGTHVGTPSLVDPYDDPVWSNVDTGSGQTYRGVKPTLYGSEMQSVTGMVLDNGRLYYSLAGQSGLHYRYFEPDDGAVGSDEFTPGGTGNFSNIAGMFLSGNTLYYADKATGNLHAVAWNGGVTNGSTDTVVSGPGIDGNDWRARGLFALTAAATPPTASFTSSCTNLACTFDASASTAPGSTITSYAWNFGDGQTGTGVNPSHTYAGGGTYTVSLTVTNALLATASTSQQVTVSAAAQPIAFVGGAATNANAATETVTVPANVVAGNAMLLFATGANAVTFTPPAGWTLVGSTPTSVTNITTSVWKKVATASDAGSNVSVGFGVVVHGTLQLAAYSGTNATNPVGASAVTTASGVTTLASPAATVTNGASWVASYWAAKSSVVTGWTTPVSQTSRSVANGSGSGRINSALVDSGAPVAAGPAGGLSATADQTAAGADSWTIVLVP